MDGDISKEGFMCFIKILRIQANTIRYCFQIRMIHSDFKWLLILIMNFFNHDFDTNIECDSSISCVELSQYNDTLVNVAYTIWNTRDTIYSKQFTVQQLFPLKNPFTYFSSVTKIVDEYKIATIYHDEDNLSMVLSDYYKLYYMPNLDDDSSRKAFLKRIYCEYESIERIAQGWYLIKLSEPLDFG